MAPPPPIDEDDDYENPLEEAICAQRVRLSEREVCNLWDNFLNPMIYATVGGHEAMVSMVALGCGVALLPEVVLENSPEPVRNRLNEKLKLTS